MERRPGLAPGKNWFASSRLDGFGMRRMEKWNPRPELHRHRSRLEDGCLICSSHGGGNLVRQPGVAPGRPLWKSGMLELLHITGAENGRAPR